MAGEVVKRKIGNPNMIKGGASINPSGRPKGILEMIDSLGIKHNAQEAFEFARDVMRCKVPDPENPTRFLNIPLALRLDAAKWLAEKRTGKAPQVMEVNKTTNTTRTLKLEVYSERQLEQMEQLLELGAVDGEIVDESPALPDVAPSGHPNP